MDYNREIHALSAQALAFGTVISYVLYRVAQVDPKFASAIAQGFDDAADHVEDFAIRAGRAASPEHTIKALQIVEGLRAGTLGRHPPKHSV